MGSPGRGCTPSGTFFSGPSGAELLTVFSIPKAFAGHIGVIQRNAIRSWMRLEPRPEILLLGNEDGTAQVAQELSLRHIPEIKTNEHGTPLLSDLFRRAKVNAGSVLLCYVNADIVLLGEFARAVAQVQKKLGKFLIVSKRINVDVAVEIGFEAGWEKLLRRQARRGGVSGDHTAIDVFVFPKETYRAVPDFGIGRLWFDQWLIKAARQCEIPVVDVSGAAAVLHQNHDYNHVSGGEERVWRGQEAAKNFRLYGSERHAYTLLSATHELRGNGGIQRVRLRKAFFTVKQAMWNLFVRRTMDVRNTLGLRRKFWPTSKSVPHAR
jgi:hypothetical protein